MSTQESPAQEAAKDPGLEEGSVRLPGVIGQSLSAMALSGVVATFVPVVVIQAGGHGWIVWAIGTLVILLIAVPVCYLSRHLTTTGGLYGFAAAALGPVGALLCGWLMVALLGIANVSAVLNFGAYFGNFLEKLGLPYNSVVLIASSLVLLAACWYLSHVGASIAAWVMFMIEVVTSSVFLILFIVVLFNRSGQIIDPPQFETKGLSVSGIVAIVVIAVGAFTGFESASIYGREAKNPRRVIPIAMFTSVILAGVAWVFSSYVIFLGFNNDVGTLSNSTAPLSDLASNVNLGWYGLIVDLVTSFTAAAAVMATFAWLSRMMLTMGRESVAPRSWAKVDPTHQTPKRSLAIVFIVWAILVVIFGSISDNPIDTFGDFLASLAGLPGLLVYAVIAAAGVAYHWKERRTVGVVGVLGSLGVLAMAYTLYTNLVPWPDFPGNLVVGILLIALIAIGVLYVWLRKQRPAVIADIGASVRADTAADHEFDPQPTA